MLIAQLTCTAADLFAILIVGSDCHYYSFHHSLGSHLECSYFSIQPSATAPKINSNTLEQPHMHLSPRFHSHHTIIISIMDSLSHTICNHAHITHVATVKFTTYKTLSSNAPFLSLLLNSAPCDFRKHYSSAAVTLFKVIAAAAALTLATTYGTLSSEAFTRLDFPGGQGSGREIRVSHVRA